MHRTRNKNATKQSIQKLAEITGVERGFGRSTIAHGTVREIMNL